MKVTKVSEYTITLNAEEVDQLRIALNEQQDLDERDEACKALGALWDELTK